MTRIDGKCRQDFFADKLQTNPCFLFPEPSKIKAFGELRWNHTPYKSMIFDYLWAT